MVDVLKKGSKDVQRVLAHLEKEEKKEKQAAWLKQKFSKPVRKMPEGGDKAQKDDRGESEK